jgi:Tfp pilus assembly protein PilN
MRPVNLLPQDQRRRAPRDGGGKGAYAVVGLLAVLLAMAVAYVLASNTVTERQEQAAAASAEADRLEAEAAAQANYSDFADIAQTRLSSVAGVAQTRFDWERLMREVSRVMPEGSWLQATDASVFGDPANPTTAIPAAGVTATPTGPYASFVGCTPDQSDVAQIMVRLRNMHRVEDVKLKESTQESNDAEASVESCGSLYKFDVGVSFTPTAPMGEAPRGADRVPASLGGGS